LKVQEKKLWKLEGSHAIDGARCDKRDVFKPHFVVNNTVS